MAGIHQTNDSRRLLFELTSVPGLSGYEKPVRLIIEKTWRPLVDTITISKLGSMHAFKAGTGKTPRSSILLSAHMDAIGLMVTGLNGGYIHFTKIGGIDPRILPGQGVTIHGSKPLQGVIVMSPARFLQPGNAEQPIEIQHLLIDTGLSQNFLEGLVRVGDLISFSQHPFNISDDIIVAHSLDNRASVAALTVFLEELKGISHVWDVWAIASTREEEGLAGAYTSGFQLRPNLAIAVDVTYAKGPGLPDTGTYPLGGGLTIGWGASIHPALTTAFVDLANELEIPHQLEIMPRSSGTDADGIQITANGIPCMLISIPLRNMHTPVEMVSLRDIHRAGRLLAEFVARLTNDFLDRLVWDD